MEYEVVALEEKVIAGVSARTRNDAPDMQQVIGGLWSDFYGKGIYAAVAGKKNGKAIGLYSDYESGASGAYDVTVACEVAADEPQREGVIKKVIPAGHYARFVVKGDMVQAVAVFWGELWNMDLDRAYTGDFEEYQDNEACATIHIYIALKG